MPFLLGLALAPALGTNFPRVVNFGPVAPAVGDRGLAIADALVPRPAETPCVVNLYSNVAFDDHGDATSRAAKPREWLYTPPTQCTGPWSKVVLDANFSVTAGRQYDRTVSLWLNGVNILFGTTQEPSANVSPHWTVERDLTAYATLFRQPGHGQTILNNWIDSTRTGTIFGSARLLFYPATAGGNTAPPADLVIGLDGDSGGQPTDVHNGQEALSRTLILPRNVERVALDLIAQSQADDEQWFMCIDDTDLEPTREFSLGPPNAGEPLGQCPGGNFRDVAVSIDGVPAGRAPVYPWVYSGGIDPNLWRPTTDIQTLNFTPYRMDLTPFAALLDDGKPHVLAVRVPDARYFFSLAANLLAWRDHGREVVTGKLTQNTLAASGKPDSAKVSRHFNHGTGGTLRGNVDTRQSGAYVIAGELHTSRGKIVTRVEHHSDFANLQTFDHPSTDIYDQHIAMRTRLTNETRTTTNAGTVRQVSRLDYPMVLDMHKQLQPNGDFTVNLMIQQGYVSKRQDIKGRRRTFWSMLDNHLDAHSNTDFKAGGTGIAGSRGQSGHQTYRFSDSFGSCYERRVDTRDQAVTAIQSGQGCPNQANHLDGRSRL